MFADLFKKRIECPHEKITPDMNAGYCPDCGRYIENQWFMTRCSCCGIKQKTVLLKGSISKATKYCKNCGSRAFAVEKLNKINFVDIHYAVLIKQIFENYHTYFIQSWVEPADKLSVKLLTSSLGCHG